MKGLSISKFLSLLLLGWLIAFSQAYAQGFFGISVTNSSAPVPVNGSITYNINLTNFTGVSLADVFVTNTFSAPVLFLSATNSQNPLAATTNANTLLFELGLVVDGGIVQMSFTALALTNGFLTNTIVVVAPGSVTNTVITNVVIQVTNTTVLADLAVAIKGPSGQIITNDWMTYGVAVTNLGPGTVTNVFLTNTLPAGVGFLSVSPTNSARPTNSVMILNLGTLASGGFKNFKFTVQPTNAGALPFIASVGSANLQDTNTANNTATNYVLVTNYFSGLLVAVTNSAQSTNRQNGLIEQSILLSNAGPAAVVSARVVVTGLANFLYNAVGTNDGNPFVVYASALNPGQSIPLLLQFYVPTRSQFPFSKSQLHPFEVSRPDLTPLPALSTSTNLNFTRILKLSAGSMLLEFPATLGQVYTVVYSDNVLFTNATTALPPILAQANYIQWVDYGPPATVSHPTNSAARFYRVYLNP